jgi:hypothetical protein
VAEWEHVGMKEEDLAVVLIWLSSLNTEDFACSGSFSSYNPAHSDLLHARVHRLA